MKDSDMIFAQISGVFDSKDEATRAVQGIEMTATQDLIAAALTAADELDFIYKHSSC
jgi:hypothetical protein